MTKRVIAVLVSAMMLFSMLGGCTQSAAPAPVTEPDVPEVSKPLETAVETVVDGFDMDQEFIVGWSCAFATAFGSAADRYIRDQFAKYPNVTLHMVNAQANTAKQVADIEDLIAKGCQAIMVLCIDTSTLNNVLQRAVDEGIVVVAVQRKIVDDIGYFVGPDFSIVGEALAKHHLEMFPDGFNFCWLLGETGNATNIEAREGFDKYMQDNGFADKVIDLDSQNSNSSRAETKTIVENWILAYGDKIDAIIAGNDEMAMGAIAALEEAGITGVSVCGANATQEILPYVKNGPVTLTFALSTGGFPGVEMTMDILSGNGDKYNNIYRIPVTPITKDNVDQYYDLVVGTDLYMLGELQPYESPIFENIGDLYPEFVPLMDLVPRS